MPPATQNSQLKIQKLKNIVNYHSEDTVLMGT